MDRGGEVSVGSALARLAGVRVPLMTLRTAVSTEVFRAFPLFSRASAAADHEEAPGRFTGRMETGGHEYPVTVCVEPKGMLIEVGPPADRSDGPKTP